LGRSLQIYFIKRFSFIYSVSNFYKNTGFYAKSSGVYSVLIYNYKDFNITKIRLPSGKNIIISCFCFAVLGRNSNLKKKYKILGGAKQSYFLGKRPHVRGVAMNPVDHPHGGRTKSNSPEVSL
jgi:large subunit ribosomal protein L2